MILKIALKNIKNSILEYRNIYLLLIVSQLVSVIMLLFVYGVVVSYEAIKKETTVKSLEMEASFDRENVTIEQLRNCIEEILVVTEDRLDYFFTGTSENGNHIGVHEEYHDGKYYLSQTVFEVDEIAKGRYFTIDEMNDGSKVIYGEEVGQVGDTYIIAGEEFKVVGVAKPYTDEVNIQIPLKSCPGSFGFSLLYFKFNKLPTKDDYNCFKEVLERNFGTSVRVKEFKPLDADSIVAINSVIVMAVIVGVIAALDTALIYGYIMKKRKKQMAVFGIIGVNKIQRIAINEIEIILISIITVSTGFVLFKFILEKPLISIYDVSIPIYTTRAYGVMLGMYLLSIMVVTLIMVICTTKNKFLDVRRGK